MFLQKKSLISGDAGHNSTTEEGAQGLKNEKQLNKETWNFIKSKLEALGFEVNDCTPWDKSFNSVKESLKFRVSKANKSNSDLHLSIHYNAGGGTGVECWISDKNDCSKEFATKICKSISETFDIRDRGVKVGKLYIPKNTKMPCVLVECAFVDSESDMKKLDTEKMAEAIVKALIEVTN